MKHVFYSILITLLLFCPKSASAIIEITGVTPAHSASMSSPPDCSGSIDLTATGNAGPFTFQWSNGATTEDINGLCKGTYYVTVTNNFGCTKVLSATVQDCAFYYPPNISISNYVVTPISASGASDGAIDITVTGGFLNDKRYKWIKQGTNEVIAATQDVSNLPAGTYCVSITGDCNYGSVSACYTIKDCATVSWAVIPTVINDCDCSDCPFHICEGMCKDGSITLNVTAPSGPKTYIWNNGSTNSSITGLSEGNYDVTIADKNTGCTITKSFVIETKDVLVYETSGCTWAASCDGVPFASYGGESYAAYGLNEQSQCVYRQYCDDVVVAETPPSGPPQKIIDWDRCIGKIVCGPMQQVIQIVYGVETLINAGENCIDQVKCTITWPDGTVSTQTQITQNYTYCHLLNGTSENNTWCEMWKFCPDIGFNQSKIFIGSYGDGPGEEEEEADCRDLPDCLNPFSGHTINRSVNVEKRPVFQIYPNPSSNFIHIAYRGLEGETFLTTSIFDFLGKEVYTQRNEISGTSGTIRLDFGNQLSSGAYRVLISGEIRGVMHQNILIHME